MVHAIVMFHLLCGHPFRMKAGMVVTIEVSKRIERTRLIGSMSYVALNILRTVQQSWQAFPQRNSTGMTLASCSTLWL